MCYRFVQVCLAFVELLLLIQLFMPRKVSAVVQKPETHAKDDLINFVITQSEKLEEGKLEGDIKLVQKVDNKTIRYYFQGEDALGEEVIIRNELDSASNPLILIRADDDVQDSFEEDIFIVLKRLENQPNVYYVFMAYAREFPEHQVEWDDWIYSRHKWTSNVGFRNTNGFPHEKLNAIEKLICAVGKCNVGTPNTLCSTAVPQDVGKVGNIQGSDQNDQLTQGQVENNYNPFVAKERVTRESRFRFSQFQRDGDNGMYQSNKIYYRKVRTPTNAPSIQDSKFNEGTETTAQNNNEPPIMNENGRDISGPLDTNNKETGNSYANNQFGQSSGNTNPNSANVNAGNTQRTIEPSIQGPTGNENKSPTENKNALPIIMNGPAINISNNVRATGYYFQRPGEPDVSIIDDPNTLNTGPSNTQKSGNMNNQEGNNRNVAGGNATDSNQSGSTSTGKNSSMAGGSNNMSGQSYGNANAGTTSNFGTQNNWQTNSNFRTENSWQTNAAWNQNSKTENGNERNQNNGAVQTSQRNNPNGGDMNGSRGSPPNNGITGSYIQPPGISIIDGPNQLNTGSPNTQKSGNMNNQEGNSRNGAGGIPTDSNQSESAPIGNNSPMATPGNKSKPCRNIVANAKTKSGSEGNAAATAISSNCNTAVANAVDGNRSTANAFSQRGSAIANTKSSGSGGSESKAVSNGNGSSSATAQSSGSGAAKSFAASQGGNARTVSDALNGSTSESLSMTNDGDALSSSRSLGGNSTAQSISKGRGSAQSVSTSVGGEAKSTSVSFGGQAKAVSTNIGGGVGGQHALIRGASSDSVSGGDSDSVAIAIGLDNEGSKDMDAMPDFDFSKVFNETKQNFKREIKDSDAGATVDTYIGITYNCNNFDWNLDKEFRDIEMELGLAVQNRSPIRRKRCPGFACSKMPEKVQRDLLDRISLSSYSFYRRYMGNVNGIEEISKKHSRDHDGDKSMNMSDTSYETKSKDDKNVSLPNIVKNGSLEINKKHSRDHDSNKTMNMSDTSYETKSKDDKTVLSHPNNVKNGSQEIKGDTDKNPGNNTQINSSEQSEKKITDSNNRNSSFIPEDTPKAPMMETSIQGSIQRSNGRFGIRNSDFYKTIFTSEKAYRPFISNLIKVYPEKESLQLFEAPNFEVANDESASWDDRVKIILKKLKLHCDSAVLLILSDLQFSKAVTLSNGILSISKSFHLLYEKKISNEQFRILFSTILISMHSQAVAKEKQIFDENPSFQPKTSLDEPISPAVEILVKMITDAAQFAYLNANTHLVKLMEAYAITGKAILSAAISDSNVLKKRSASTPLDLSMSKTHEKVAVALIEFLKYSSKPLRDPNINPTELFGKFYKRYNNILSKISVCIYEY